MTWACSRHNPSSQITSHLTYKYLTTRRQAAGPGAGPGARGPGAHPAGYGPLPPHQRRGAAPKTCGSIMWFDIVLYLLTLRRCRFDGFDAAAFSPCSLEVQFYSLVVWGLYAGYTVLL